MIIQTILFAICAMMFTWLLSLSLESMFIPISEKEKHAKDDKSYCKTYRL